MTVAEEETMRFSFSKMVPKKRLELNLKGKENAILRAYSF